MREGVELWKEKKKGLKYLPNKPKRREKQGTVCRSANSLI